MEGINGEDAQAEAETINFEDLPKVVLWAPSDPMERILAATWLKDLIYTILYDHYSKPTDPLVTHNPHELVPVLEFQTYNVEIGGNPSSDYPSTCLYPPLFRTHFPYELFPESVKRSDCKIVYVSSMLPGIRQTPSFPYGTSPTDEDMK